MATNITSRLGLTRPLAGHGFSRSEYYNNLGIVNNYPGIFPCTSGTRPGAWGTAHRGMVIYETDTTLYWRWDGAKFARLQPKGILGTSSLTSDVSTAATTAFAILSSVVAVPAFTVGSTTKRIKIEASWYAVVNGTDTTLGVAEVAIVRDPSTVLAVQRVVGRPDTDSEPLNWGTGGSIVAWDDPSAGAATYHLAINSIASVGGTTTIKASATQPAVITVSEVGL